MTHDDKVSRFIKHFLLVKTWPTFTGVRSDQVFTFDLFGVFHLTSVIGAHQTFVDIDTSTILHLISVVTFTLIATREILAEFLRSSTHVGTSGTFINVVTCCPVAGEPSWARTEVGSDLVHASGVLVTVVGKVVTFVNIAAHSVLVFESDITVTVVIARCVFACGTVVTGMNTSRAFVEIVAGISVAVKSASTATTVTLGKMADLVRTSPVVTVVAVDADFTATDIPATISTNALLVFIPVTTVPHAKTHRAITTVTVMSDSNTRTECAAMLTNVTTLPTTVTSTPLA
jgi:hypothetical protein